MIPLITIIVIVLLASIGYVVTSKLVKDGRNDLAVGFACFIVALGAAFIILISTNDLIGGNKFTGLKKTPVTPVEKAGFKNVEVETLEEKSARLLKEAEEKRSEHIKKFEGIDASPQK